MPIIINENTNEFRLALYDFSGGLNTRDSASVIKENELSDIRNLIYKKRKALKIRKGRTRLIINNWGDNAIRSGGGGAGAAGANGGASAAGNGGAGKDYSAYFGTSVGVNGWFAGGGGGGSTGTSGAGGSGVIIVRFKIKTGGVLKWFYFKEAWEKHDKLWKPKILKPEFEI